MIPKSRKHTLVLGASLNPERFSNICINELVDNGFPVSAVGLRNGIVAGIAVMTGLPQLSNIHTVTLYLGPKNQPQYYDYLMNLKPARIIFNPGTWNPELAELAANRGINTEQKCTLMMISGGYY
ncbi:CoA-binding protein [Lentimicrobium sp.]|jgi:predicted CoA-binding protein|uniref:CoA-binding protein n=1 Tax=Lentimicrobium sp. TaxID=2034841 RepID=UPI0025E89B68|nr:CoA-binding protein [Lentimicrobium sp.]MCO5257206.1 CoA-binding protein [Lentimicrobium sp.]MCO5263879.1 CoA-binding protein [Lentimicrobium sp.]HOP13282.1 CoA-binding protein [Lentimicrobium sp.]HPF64929.1 CoA-binding protein [Lentimicrobium sp.]HPJ61549.1 CoA-binding protein [Lentimicrobium sp.]